LKGNTIVYKINNEKEEKKLKKNRKKIYIYCTIADNKYSIYYYLYYVKGIEE